MNAIKTLAVAMTVLIAGCATNYANKDSASVERAVELVSSDFDRGIAFVGPDVRNENLFSSETARLIHMQDPVDGDTTYLAVDFLYTSGGWAFYESASFRGGERRPLDDAQRDTLGCSSAACTHLEKTLLVLPEGYLESKRASGFDIRYNARKAGTTMVNIPSSYVQGFLAALP